MNCRTYRKNLTAGTAIEPAELKRHRDTCPRCQLFGERYRAAEQLLSAPAANERDQRPRPGFAAGVVAALSERPDPLAWAAVRLLPATSALALTLLGWCWLATPTPGELWAQAGEDELLTWVLSEDDDGREGRIPN
ncbi:MAG: hypothetical protein GY769_00740 [bacterium]|nr:hypothetical protein [bacterium]